MLLYAMVWPGIGGIAAMDKKTACPPSVAMFVVTVAASYGFAWAGPELLGGEVVLLWWWGLVPAVFYVAPIVHLVRRRASPDTQICRPALEAIGLSLAAVAGLLPAFSVAWIGLEYSAFCNDDQIFMHLLYSSFHPPPVPWVQPVALVLDSALAMSAYFLVARGRDLGDAGVLASLVCFFGLPLLNVVGLMAVALAAHEAIGILFFTILIVVERTAFPLGVFVFLWRRARKRSKPGVDDALQGSPGS